MGNSVSGRVIYVGQTTNVGKSKPFNVRTLVIVTNEDRWPEYLRLDAQQNNVDRLDAIKANDLVQIDFYLKGQQEVKLDRNNQPTAMTSPIISAITKTGEDPYGGIPDIVKSVSAPTQGMQQQGLPQQGYQQQVPVQPQSVQPQSNEAWINQQHANQQAQQQQGFNAAPPHPSQQTGFPQQQQQWQQAPVPGTIPPTSPV